MKKTIIVAVAAMLLPLICGAQALKGSYFMDNSVNRHNMNPAFAPRANYFKIPVAGNVSRGAGISGLGTFEGEKSASTRPK